MHTAYYKEFSTNLNRDMEFSVYGHAGKPCIVFPSQDGRFFDFASNGMVECCKEFIEAGKLQLFCVDGNDWNSWTAKGDEGWRIGQQEDYVRYICEEFVPRVYEIHNETSGEDYWGKIMTTGCSMGATHALNFLLRRPDIFDAVMGMSGVYHAAYFFPNYHDSRIYFNSPTDFMKGMPWNHSILEQYRNCQIVLSCGQGAWETEAIEDLTILKNEFERLQVPAWCDFWGYDVNHDWPWWRVQFPYFLSKMNLD